MAAYAAMRPLIEAGKLKVLAVTSRQRAGIAPAIPTVVIRASGIGSLGIPPWEMLIWRMEPVKSYCRRREPRRLKAFMASTGSLTWSSL